jgi:hypothetical protein
MENQTIIFLPDISGFTEFVNKTEIEHSQHIISELLETIINSHHLGFTISEIEGDAILFYKNSSIPSFKEILDQSKEMFINFHKHLKNIEVNSVCQCGACRTASNLSLKFITHIGNIKEVKVKEFNKLIGSDLILAHRLLKNNIPSNEYLLLSEKYLSQNSIIPASIDSWVKFNDNHEEIDKFGLVASKYIDFKPLLDLVPNQVNEAEVEQYNRNPDIYLEIKASILLVHNALTDPNKKYEFVPGIKKIITDNEINRINSSHTCIFDNSEIHFVTKNNLVEKNKITYSEEAEFGNNFKFIADYRLQENKDKTTLSIYFFIPRLERSTNSSFIKRIKEYFFLKFIIFKNKKSIKSFKDYCESINNNIKQP